MRRRGDEATEERIQKNRRAADVLANRATNTWQSAPLACCARVYRVSEAEILRWRKEAFRRAVSS